MAYYDIGEVFQKIEEDMIASMMRNLKRHLATEKEEGLNYAMWQAEQLAALNEFKRNNSSLFKGYFSTINEQIEEVLKKAHETGKMEQEIKILEAIREGWSTALKPSSKLQGAFFRINDRKLKALINSVNNDMKKAETAMLRRANDEYRKIIFNSQAYYNVGTGTLPQCVDMATKDFLSRGITCIEYANGARVGIDAYSRMAIRTASTRAYLLGESAKRDEWGVSTVIVNKRGVACPRCMRYVGRVFYDDVWGSAPIPSPEKYPRLSEAIAGGLYHPNCRDIHTTYFEGISTPPEPMTAAEKEEATRVYNLEQQQRYNERQIRKYKRLSDGSVDPENQLRYQKKLEAWQDEQRRFVKANGDVLKRRYENEKLLVSEFSDPPKTLAIAKQTHQPKDLTNVGNSDKIKTAKLTPAKTIEEAMEVAKRFNVNADYTKFNIDVANSINETLFQIEDTFGSRALARIQHISTFPKGYSTQWKGIYVPNQGALWLRNVSRKDAMEKLRSVALEAYKDGEWSTPDALHTIRHELGHAIHHALENGKINGQLNSLRQSIIDEIMKDHNHNYSDWLSEYGFADIKEFAAESIAEYLAGNPRETAAKVVEILIKGG